MTPVTSKKGNTTRTLKQRQSPLLKSGALEILRVSTPDRNICPKQKLTWVPFKATSDSLCAITFSPESDSHADSALSDELPEAMSEVALAEGNSAGVNIKCLWMEAGYFGRAAGAFHLSLQFPRAASISWPAVVRKHVGNSGSDLISCAPGSSFLCPDEKRCMRFNLAYDTSTAVAVKVVPC